MARLGTPIHSSLLQRPGLQQRIRDLNAELLLLASECKDLTEMDAAAVVTATERIDRRLTMLRHGALNVRNEAKIMARAEKFAVAKKAVHA